MGADAPPPGSKGIGDRAFGRYGVATVVMQILLVGGCDVDGSAELTLLDVNVEQGQLCTYIHIKPTNHQQYLHYHS